MKHRALILGAGAIASLVVIILLCAIFRPNGDIAAFIQHPATAGWIQALGSVGALLLLVTVARADRRAALDADDRRRATDVKADRVGAISVVLVAAERCRNVALVITHEETAKHGWRQAKAAIASAQRSVEAYPAHLVRNAAATVQMSHIPGILSHAVEQAELLADAHAESDPKLSEIETGVSKNLTMLADVMDQKALALIELFDLKDEFKEHLQSSDRP